MTGTFLTTANFGLRRLLGTSKGADIDEGFQRLAEDVDQKMLGYVSDTLAKRPAAGIANRIFRASDTGVIYRDTGTIWIADEWPGKLAFVANASVLDGYLACDGSAVSRSTYALLFAAIGVSQGAGDGSTTFNVPDYRERVPVGKGGALALAAKGGEATHKLTTAEMPAHIHTAGQGVWEYAVGGGGATNSAGAAQPMTANFSGVDSAGGGGTHNNMQPYTVCNVWIRHS